MGDSRKRFRDIFKRGKRKQPESESESHGSASWEDTPSSHPSIQLEPPLGPSLINTAVAGDDAWPNLAAFSSLLHQTPLFAPLAEVIDDLSWFIRGHEEIIGARERHTELHIRLEALFKDLHVHFSAETPPAMTTSMLNLCAAIRTELRKIYGTQDRNVIARYMQANQDLNKIAGCYRRIQNHLERVMLNATLNIPRTHDKQMMEVRLRYLNPSMSANYNSAEAHLVQRRECTPNTREQVLLDLRAWKDKPDGEKVCWMSGMAGTGKTTIMNTFCSTLDQSYELGASFFCTRAMPPCRDVKLILPTIAYQLARFSDPFRGALVQVLDRDPDVHTKEPRTQFQRMILEPLLNVKGSLPSNVVVVIDALDECEDNDGVEKMLKVLLETASELPVKLLISSRPEYHIRDRIGGSVQNAQVTLHELDEKIVKADIEKYLRAELAFLAIPLTEEQLKTLVERAGVLFIYAATIIWYIRGTNVDPVKRLNTVLRAPGLERGPLKQFEQIDRLYEYVLVSAVDDPDMDHLERQQMELVLHTVICTQEPLTIEALSGLLDLSSSEVIAALRPLWSVLHVSGQNTTDRVSILHASFPDYILDPTRSRRYACNAELHHGKLAELCFRRIGQNIPQFNICGLESSYMLDENVPDIDEKVKQAIPLDLLYACQYWAVHLCLGEKSDKRATELHDFLSKRLLLCIEVLNLTKGGEKGITLMELAMSWLQDTGRFESTKLLARDAWRFTTMFATSSISQSTPHLYVSMLASWPQNSAVSYFRQATQVVRFKGIETAGRQLGLLSLIPVGPDVRCVSYSSDGRFFAAGTSDNRIIIWDAVSCRMTIDPIIGHTSSVTALAISPDGTRICSGSYDASVRIWDTHNGKIVACPLLGHKNAACSVSYSPDGRWLASGSAHGIISIWSTTSWQQQSLIERDEPVYSLVFSPESTTITAGFGSVIYLWDLLSGRAIGDPLQGHTGYIRSLAFLPDGKHLVSGSSDCTICVWDVISRRIVFGPFHEHTDGVSDLKISPDGRSLASAGEDDTIRIWNTETWQSRTLFRDTGVVRSLMFSPDGLRLVSGSADGNVRIWEGEGYFDKQATIKPAEGHESWVRSVSFSPRGTHVISGSDDATMCIWDLQSKELMHNPLQHNHPILFVGVSTDSEHIFSITQDRMIHVWSKQSGELEDAIGPIETNDQDNLVYDEFWPAAFLFEGKRIVCGSKSGQLYIQEGSKQTYSFTGPDRAVYSIAFSPDGQSFTSGASDGALMIWGASTGERLFSPLIGHSGSICSIAYSPDGGLLASGSWDRTIRLWSSLTGTSVGDVFQGHTRVVRSVAFSPSGNHLVSGSEDMTIRIWDVMGGQSIAVFQGHKDKVLSVAFSPDGAQIVSGSADTTVRLWNVPAQRDVSSGARTERVVNAEEEDLGLEWNMDNDGWVLDAQNRLLVWVPPDLRTTLLQPYSGLILRQGCIELEFANARIGNEWQTCYEPFPPAARS